MTTMQHAKVGCKDNNNNNKKRTNPTSKKNKHQSKKLALLTTGTRVQKPGMQTKHREQAAAQFKVQAKVKKSWLSEKQNRMLESHSMKHSVTLAKERWKAGSLNP